MRRLRVYQEKAGGFVIDIPDDARVTFGYFNPGTAGQPWAHGSKPTALRIYAAESTKTKESQIACFINVSGFRDLALPYEITPLNALP